MVNERPRASRSAKAPETRLPHSGNRVANQPYTTEYEDYDEGVHRPPEENPTHPPAVSDAPVGEATEKRR